MCGIAAVLDFGGRLAGETLASAAGALRHRGPDGQRTWLSAGQEVGLAHSRLAIIDLTTGDQPLANEDGSLRLVVNGEFYGYEAVRGRLRQAGHRLATATDSEIALHLYEDLDHGFLDRLRGEFALVLWDERRRRLLAARDRFGIKPLYYTTFGGSLYLASEVKALQAMGVPLAWDREAVLQMMLLGALSPSRSLFRGVSQIPPGNFLLADASGTRIERYWDFQFPATAEESPAQSGIDLALIRDFRSALEEAVGLRLRADVPVGCYLSGGLDSSSVLGLAARHAGRPLDAFTVVFDHASYDESAVAEETARLCGARWHPLRVGLRDLADHFAETVWHVEGLLTNGNSVAKFLLSRAAAKAGIKVVLTGEGSDEALAGYALFQKDLAPAPRSGPEEGIGFMPAWLATQIANGERHRALLASGALAEARTQDVLARFLRELDSPAASGDWKPLPRSLYLWAKTVLPNYILAAGGDRVEMAHAVEGRPPFLDHEVVERAARLPSRLLFADGNEKYALRQAVRPLLTDAVYRRRKQPFLAPPASLELAGPFFECLRDLLSGPGLDALPFCDAERVRAEIEALASRPAALRLTLDSVLMKLASLVVLGQRFRLSA